MKTFSFKISLKLKRLMFFIKSLKEYIYSSFLWLFCSKEHTSFSIKLSKDSENFLARSISNFTNLSYDEIIKIIYANIITFSVIYLIPTIIIKFPNTFLTITV